MAKKTKSKNKSNKIPNIKKLNRCKECNQQLKNTDIFTSKKIKLPEKYGVYWTGIEQPYIQNFKVECPNLSCNTKYTHKYRGSNWLYK